MNERAAVVTGANRGIGRAIAVALAADGFSVVITAVAGPRIEDLIRKQIQSHGVSEALID